MESELFDRAIRMLGAGATRRAGLRAAVAAIFGAGAAAGADARGAGREPSRPARGDRHGSGPGAAGPCGDGSAKDNRCTKGSDCCTGHCSKARGRCRCVQRGNTCKTDANCCGGMTCTKRKCTPPPKPVKPVRNGEACGPTDTCADANAACTTYVGGSPAGTYCLLPYQAACGASSECETNDCGGGLCISCSCEGCGGTCTPTVCSSCTYTTVQAAIDAATDGDIIHIAPGTYSEDITLTHSVTLRGCPGGDVILMNLTAATRTITDTAGMNLTLIDIIVDANGDGTASGFTGGIATAGNLTMCRNSIVRNGSANVSQFTTGGGCVYVSGISPNYATFTMNDQSVVENCKAAKKGGAVHLNLYAHMVMNDNTQVRNSTTGGNGGGVFSYNVADLVMNDSAKITGNHSDKAGGGVHVTLPGGNSFVLQMNDLSAIEKNTATTGGGGVIVDRGDSSGNNLVQLLDDATIADNSSDSYGGGVVLNQSAMTMAGRSSVTGNTTKYGGGGILVSGSLPWTAAHSLVISEQATVSNNNGDTYGGGIVAGFATVLIEDAATVTGNTTGGNGGGVYLKSSGANPSALEITGTATVSGNTAVLGGGLYGSDASQTVTGSAAITGNTPDNCVGATGC